MAMQNEASWVEDSFVAEADLRLYQYHGVKFGTADNQINLAGAGEAVGILQNKPNIREAALVVFFGIAKGLLDGTGAIAKGDSLTTDASGHFIKTAGDNQNMCALAMEACTASGDIATVLAVGPRRY